MRRGWFDIPGVQVGQRSQSESMAGMEPVLDRVRGASVLDLGCAEGMYGRWLLEAGAVTYHGVDVHEPYVRTARERVFQHNPAAHFLVADLDHVDHWSCWARPSYDIVLVMNILQKLPRPGVVLAAAAARCSGMLCVSLPGPILVDPRSNNVPLDPTEELAGSFRLVGQVPAVRDPMRGSLGHKLFYLRRR